MVLDDEFKVMPDLHFLFLQGLPSPFFSRIARQLAALDCRVTGINLCVGDQLFWRGPNTVNYRGRFSGWSKFIAEFLDKNSVTDIVLLGEQRSYHKLAIEAAQARDIRVTVTDFGYLRPDWITLERDGMSGNSKFPKDPEAILRLAKDMPNAEVATQFHDSFWIMAAGDMLYHFANYFFWWLFPHYRRPYKRDHPILHYLSIGRRLLFAGREHLRASQRLTELKAGNARYFFFPLQLENDFQIVAYSPFDCLESAIQTVIKSFAENADANTRLLVKVHPLDPGIKNWKKLIYKAANELGIGDRVDYFDGGNLDEIIDGSAGMVSVNSTTGIRALQLGSPVIALGSAIYDVSGLTYQGQLDNYWKEAERPDAAFVGAFVNAIASTIQLRGVFYSEPGLSAAVSAAVDRLYGLKVGPTVQV
ncbi:MAG: capsule biosynthesis protein [Gammaproteobacteria bacterium]